MNNIIEFINEEIARLKLNSKEMGDTIHTYDLDIEGSKSAIEKIKSNNEFTSLIFLSTNEIPGFDGNEIKRLNQMIDNLLIKKENLINEKKKVDDRVQILEDLLKENHKRELCEFTSYDIIKSIELERQRIARDIHDSIIQNLTAIMYKNEFVKKVIDTDYNRAKVELEAENDMVKDCINELRNIIYNLHPMAVDDLCLENVFYDLIEKIKSSTNMIVEYSYSSDINELDYSVIIVMLRIIQELCNNSIKHSNGTIINVSIKISNGIIKLIQSDNGIGYDCNTINKPKNNNTGFGLSLLKERIQLVHGTVNIRKLSQQGMEYEINIPVPDMKKLK